MRRLTRTVAAAALATALALVSACSSGSDSADDAKGGDGKALEKVTYLTSFGNFGRDSYAWVAKDKGFFKEAGFDVEIKPGQGTGARDPDRRRRPGRLRPDRPDRRPARSSATARPRTSWRWPRSSSAPWPPSSRVEGKNIASPKDLEGKKLADTPGSVVRNLFPTYARLAGVDDNKVTWVNGEAQTLIGTLASGRWTASASSSSASRPSRRSTKKKPVVLPYSNVMQDLYGNALITSSKIAKEKPEMVKKFTAALLKGLEYALAQPAGGRPRS